jgi:hypothetical protein
MNSTEQILTPQRMSQGSQDLTHNEFHSSYPYKFWQTLTSVIPICVIPETCDFFPTSVSYQEFLSPEWRGG